MVGKLASKLPERGIKNHLNGVQVVGGSNPLAPTSNLASNFTKIPDYISEK